MTDLDDTIALLSKDVHMSRPTRHFGWGYAILTVASIIFVAGLTIVATMGNWMAFRPDYMLNISDPDLGLNIALKQLLPLLITLLILLDLRGAIYPEQTPSGWRFMVGLLPLLALPVLFIMTLSHADSHQWVDMVSGGSLLRCVIMIPMLALLILAAQITALSHTAPQYPTWLGCRAGLIAGALATIIYAFYCTEDTPAFYGLWYAFGIILTAGIGAASGQIFLRW